jgi:LysW-gamma-L-alpha-aminoadipyl-6-phosphate/LysW-L-glutamyl-5-phosphate reductase
MSDPTKSVAVAILGASGFGGGELLRLLCQHPKLGDLQAISRTAASKTIGAVHPHLRHLRFNFSEQVDWDRLGGATVQSVLFAALPHGEFAKLWPTLRKQLPARTLVIDLSADFRLRDANVFANSYGYAHPCPEFLDDFQYLIPELAKLSIDKHIANPGCFATAIALALYPLCGVEVGHVCVSAVTGSSGSGASPAASTHHPTRAQDFRAYKILQHQHESEIRACLQVSGRSVPTFSLVPHSAPMVRGIFATAQFAVRSAKHAEQIRSAFAAQYGDQNATPFVHYIDESPRVASVAGSNYAELSLHINNDQAAVLCAIDNLGKGMAGQAIQNMNLSLGFPADLGLTSPALYP